MTPPTQPDPLIHLILRTDHVGLATLQAAAEAVQIQAREHLAPHWDVGENCVIEVIGPDQRPNPAAWWMLVVDEPDIADALGYHDATPEGRPVGKIFARPLAEAGLPISGAVSHEVLESLVDPRINEWSYDDNGAFYATEISDAVQGIANDYKIDSVTVADFVLPSFFHRRDRTPPYDYRDKVERPFQTLPGGYQLRYTRARGMHQVYGSRRSMLRPGAWRRPSPPAGSRRERRMRGRDSWRPSAPR